MQIDVEFNKTDAKKLRRVVARIRDQSDAYLTVAEVDSDRRETQLGRWDSKRGQDFWRWLQRIAVRGIGDGDEVRLRVRGYRGRGELLRGVTIIGRRGHSQRLPAPVIEETDTAEAAWPDDADRGRGELISHVSAGEDTLTTNRREMELLVRLAVADERSRSREHDFVMAKREFADTQSKSEDKWKKALEKKDRELVTALANKEQAEEEVRTLQEQLDEAHEAISEMMELLADNSLAGRITRFRGLDV